MGTPSFNSFEPFFVAAGAVAVSVVLMCAREQSNGNARQLTVSYCRNVEGNRDTCALTQTPGRPGCRRGVTP